VISVCIADSRVDLNLVAKKIGREGSDLELLIIKYRF
jgi:hypothetical protein